MRVRTGLVAGGLVLVLLLIIVVGFGTVTSSGDLSEAWVSDTARHNEFNHHATGVGPDGGVIVAPIAAVPGADVTLSDTSCALTRLHPANGSALWRHGVPAEVCGSHALTEPTIADVDRDGTLEAISATTEGTLLGLDARTGRAEFRAPIASYGYGRPTVADLWPSPGREIVTSDIRGNVALVASNGTVLWTTALNRTFGRNPIVWDSPNVGDVNADGERDIALGTNAGPVVLSANGTVRWFSEARAKEVVVAQADADPQLELFATGTQTIRAIDGRTHEREWQRTFEAIPRIRDIADGDGDGAPELYAGLSDGSVVALDVRDGGIEWSTPVSTGGARADNAPVAANLDGSGPPEIVAVTRGGTVAVLDGTDGSERAAYARNVPIRTFATPADIDDDSREEILVHYGDARVVALDFEP